MVSTRYLWYLSDIYGIYQISMVSTRYLWIPMASMVTMSSTRISRVCWCIAEHQGLRLSQHMCAANTTVAALMAISNTQMFSYLYSIQWKSEITLIRHNVSLIYTPQLFFGFLCFFLAPFSVCIWGLSVLPSWTDQGHRITLWLSGSITTYLQRSNGAGRGHILWMLLVFPFRTPKWRDLSKNAGGVLANPFQR